MVKKQIVKDTFTIYSILSLLSTILGHVKYLIINVTITFYLVIINEILINRVQTNKINYINIYI